MKSGEYLKKLTKPIRNREVRKEIFEEYKSHILECKETLVEMGMSEEEAEEKAVQQMGDPVVCGQRMNRIYHQWIDWDIVKRMSIMTILALIVSSLINFFHGGIEGTGLVYADVLIAVPLEANYIVGSMVSFINLSLFIWAELSSDTLKMYGEFQMISGFFLMIATLFFASTRAEVVIGMLFFTLLMLGIHAGAEYFRARKTTRCLWEVGVADTDISVYRGYGKILGKKQKVLAKSGEIPKGHAFIIVDMSGFRPVVEEL